MEMRHQNGTVPENLQAEWEDTSDRLARAAEQLDVASRAYHEAIVARIALSEIMNGQER